MHASTVRAVFSLLLPVLHFVADPRTLVRLRINFTEVNFQLFLSKCGNNCSERNKRCAIAKFELGHYVNFLYVKFRQKQHINGQHPAEQARKIWHKNFQALLTNHILGVGSFF